MFRLRSLVVALLLAVLGAASLHAGDVRIPLPKKSKYTPVQKLNRDGVAAVERHDYEKAKKLFYKAYLIDPNDPFTLNNLGYLAELEGNTDRAQRFYELSSQQNSDAVVDKATNDLAEGKPVSSVAGNAEVSGIKINRLNSQAIALLNKDRAPEADLLLQKALTIDSRNPFTLNNLGYAKEKEGELDAAYQFYTAAANTNSRERVEVSVNKDWRGRAISSVAKDNANKLRHRIGDDTDIEARVAILNLRGVSAMNRNDRRTARDFIQQAYKLSPNNAFTLNNMGYLAEMDGDRETADYYYDRAREANDKGARITLATRKEAEGKRIGELADNTDSQVLTRIDADRIARQRTGGPVMLHRRDNTAIVETKEPPPQPQYRVSDANGNLILPPRRSSEVSQPTGASQGGLAMPLPDTQQPTTVHSGQTDGGMIMPLPDDEQPGAKPSIQQAQPAPGQGQNNGGLMMPLPDDQQPAAKTPTPPSQPSPQSQPQSPGQGQNNGGLTMPLPDDQQPAAPPQPQSTQPQASQPQNTPPPPAQAQPPATPPQAPANGGLLLPPPDNQQPGNTPPQNTTPQTQPPPSQAPQTTPPQSQTAPRSNIGVYTPPRADGSTTPSNPPPKKISDTDPSKPKQSTTTPSNSNVKRISDQ